jgi:hypothetical protein
MPLELGLGLSYQRKVGAGVTDALSRFWAGGVSGKTILMFGDSTTQVANQMWAQINAQIKTPGGELAGVTFINGGQNGQTQAGANTNLSAWVYANNPHLLVSCFGINDVRLGVGSTAQLRTDIGVMMSGVQANLPNCDIVLWTPNAMLSTDPTSSGFVVPVANAQIYTDQMWNAYNNSVGSWQHTAWVDKQQATGRTCLPTSGNMDDILRPSNAGQTLNLIPLINRIKPPVTPINLTASAAAWASNPNNPWTVYARALEDTRYTTVVKPITIGTFLDLNPSYLYYWWCRWNDPAGSLQVADLQPLDFFATPMGNFQLTGGETKSNLSGGVQIQLPIAGGAPNTGQDVNGVIYRRIP